jgi:hypothetical protein
MTKLILAIVAFAVPASTSAMAAPIARKVPPRFAEPECWWEPPVFYRYHAYFPYYPYSDDQGRGRRQGYYAPRWSGYRWW